MYQLRTKLFMWMWNRIYRTNNTYRLDYTEGDRMDERQGTADVVVEAIGTENADNDDKGQQGPETTAITLSNEQFLRVEIRLPAVDADTQTAKLSHLVLVVDNSGSMAGQPWKQVQQSLHAIVGSSIRQPNIKLDLIVYNTKAHDIALTLENYEETINTLKTEGMTSFVSAFQRIDGVVSAAGAEYKQTTVVMLTDGQDTVNNGMDLRQLIPKLKEGFLQHGKQATVHTVGFSKDHDFRFLKDVAENGGTSPGMFRYCEPGENKQALQEKLDELFDFILQSDDRSVTIECLDQKCTVLGKNGFQKSVTVTAKVAQSVEEEDQAVVLNAEAWIRIENPRDLPVLSISVETTTKEGNGTQTVNLPCVIKRLERNILETATEKTEWRLRILERNVEDLMNKTASKIAEKGDVSHIQAKIEKYQKRISHTKVFGTGISKECRTKMLEIIKCIQINLDQVQTMLADYMRSGTDSISLLARAHDMRYQAVFQKSRRQRVMNKRAAQNMQHAVDAQKRLASLAVDPEEIRRLSQDALQFFFCVMSQNSVKDVLLGDDLEDGIGFGLAVKRSEVVLDEPTLIRLQVISGTLVSRNAMLDALEYKLNVSSHLKAHGGFEFDPATLGVTTVGTSREPINAWLPLYITKSHWERIKLILKPALGSFCTLDPLGYHYKQLDVLFMVLGSMIGQLSVENMGEHQLRLLFAVLRTCAACLVDFDKEKEVIQLVKDFVESPSGRTKDLIPNLYVLIGYVVVLGEDTRRDLFDQKGSLKKFWLAFISEWLRRAAGPIYHDSSKPIINGVLHALLNGLSVHTPTTDQGSNATGKLQQVQNNVTVGRDTEGNSASTGSDNQNQEGTVSCCFVNELIRLCREADTLRVDIGTFDPASEITVPQVELKHSDDVDRAMEVWAEKTTGHQKNLDKTKKYRVALRQVQQWLHENRLDENKEGESTCEGKDSTNEESEDSGECAVDVNTKGQGYIETSSEAKHTAFTEDIKEGIIQVIAHVQHRLVQGASPYLSTFPGLMAFVNTWLEKNHELAEIDNNSGIAPESWINEIKTALREMHTEIKRNATIDHVAGQADVTECAVIEGQQGQQEVLQDDYHQELSSNKDFKEAEEVSDDQDAPAMYGMYSDDDDDDPGIGDVYNIRITHNKIKKDSEKRERITLPEVLRYIDGDLDVVGVLRAMLCQAVRYHSNSSARAACTSKQLLDVTDGEVAQTVFELNRTSLEEVAVNAKKSVIEKAFWKRANHCMVYSTTPWAFIGYLMNTHTSRLEGFIELVNLFMETVEGSKTIPYLPEKVHILLTGKYQDHAVLDNGNQWLPEKKMAVNFRKLLGDEVWTNFEIELRSSVQIHVYRASDIPNRHGHCNSNPYIPNVLRAKLGMALMPEENNKRRSRKSKK